MKRLLQWVHHKTAPTVEKKSAGWNMWSDSGIWSPIGYRANESDYIGLVSACVDAIVRDVVSQPYYFSRVGSTDPLDARQISKDIIAPFSGRWNGVGIYDALRIITHHLLMKGNGYLWVRRKTPQTALQARDGAGYEFVPLTNCTPTLRTDGEGIEYYTALMQGISRQLDPSEVIHVRQNAIISPFIGVGNITKLRLDVDGAKASAEYVTQFMTDASKMPQVIITDTTRSDMAEAEKIKMQLRQRTNGRVMIYSADEGTSMFETSTIAKDFDFIASRKYSDDQILAVFGVPRLLLGLPEGSNKSTSGNQIPLYYRSSINPRLLQISDAINSQFIAKIDPSIQFNLKPHPTGDVDDTIKMVLNGIITPNEASQRLGEATNLDDQSRNTYYIPSSVIPIEMAGESSEPPHAEEVEEEQPNRSVDQQGIEAKRADDPRNVEHIVSSFEKSAPPIKRFQAQYLRASLTSRSAMVEKYVGSYSEYFKNQAKEINAIFTAKKSLEDEQKINDIKKDVEAYMATQATTEGQLLTPLHTSGVQRGVADINVITGAGVIATTSNPFVRFMIADLGVKITGKLTATTLQDLRSLFQKAVEEGWAVVQLQSEIADKFSDYQGYRARMIARTEARMAWDAGAMVAYEDLGVKSFDVVGCTQFEPNSDCGKINIPLARVKAGLTFHPNHIGAVAPSDRI